MAVIFERLVSLSDGLKIIKALKDTDLSFDLQDTEQPAIFWEVSKLYPLYKEYNSSTEMWVLRITREANTGCAYCGTRLVQTWYGCGELNGKLETKIESCTDCLPFLRKSMSKLSKYT